MNAALKESMQAWIDHHNARADAAEAKLAEAVAALVGVVNVADRKTKEFDAAHKIIAIVKGRG